LVSCFAKYLSKGLSVAVTSQVAPVLEQAATTRTVFLPGAGPWYDARTSALVRTDETGSLTLQVDMDSVPSFLRGGHIMPVRVLPPLLQIHT
jgi:hypothetical protein